MASQRNELHSQRKQPKLLLIASDLEIVYHASLHLYIWPTYNAWLNKRTIEIRLLRPTWIHWINFMTSTTQTNISSNLCHTIYIRIYLTNLLVECEQLHFGFVEASKRCWKKFLQSKNLLGDDGGGLWKKKRDVFSVMIMDGCSNVELQPLFIYASIQIVFFFIGDESSPRRLSTSLWKVKMQRETFLRHQTASNLSISSCEKFLKYQKVMQSSREWGKKPKAHANKKIVYFVRKAFCRQKFHTSPFPAMRIEK